MYEKDITGLRFGRLVAVKFSGWHEFPSGQKHALWEAVCDCGTVKSYHKRSMISGHSTSCGCLKRENPPRLRHGYARDGKKTPEWVIWSLLKQRKAGMHTDWSNFEVFLAEMGERPFPKAELDRIKNELPYGPGNCRWVTKTQNVRNRTNTVKVEFEGAMITIAELAEKYGLKYDCVLLRYHKGKRGYELIRPSQQKPKGS